MNEQDWLFVGLLAVLGLMPAAAVLSVKIFDGFVWIVRRKKRNQV